MIRVCVLLLLLAACVAPPVAPGQPTPFSLGVANLDAGATLTAAQAQQAAIQREIMAATERAQATESAYVFAQRQTRDAQAAAEAAHNLAVTRTAEAIYLGMTQVAITSTAVEERARGTATAQVATATAVAHAPTAEYEAMVGRIQQTEIPRQATAAARIAVSRENRAETIATLGLAFMVLLVLALSIISVILLWELLAILVTRKRIIMAGNIPVWLDATLGPQTLTTRLITAPAEGEWVEEDPRTISIDGREVPAMTAEEAQAIKDREKRQAEAHRLARRLIRDTMDYWYGHKSWERERRIPGHRDLASVGYYWWDVEKWTIATNELGQHLEKIRGKGTFIRGEMDMSQLWEMTRKDHSPTLRARVPA